MRVVKLFGGSLELMTVVVIEMSSGSGLAFLVFLVSVWRLSDFSIATPKANKVNCKGDKSSVLFK